MPTVREEIREGLTDRYGNEPEKWITDDLVRGYAGAHGGKVDAGEIVRLVDTAAAAAFGSALDGHNTRDLWHELFDCGWRRQTDAVGKWGGDAGKEALSAFGGVSSALVSAIYDRFGVHAENAILGGGIEGWNTEVRDHGVTHRDTDALGLSDPVARMIAAEGSRGQMRGFMGCPKRISNMVYNTIKTAIAKGEDTYFTRGGVMDALRELDHSRGITKDEKLALEKYVVQDSTMNGFTGWGTQDDLTVILRAKHVPDKAEFIEKYCTAEFCSDYRNAAVALAKSDDPERDRAIGMLLEMPVDETDCLDRIYAVLDDEKDDIEKTEPMKDIDGQDLATDILDAAERDIAEADAAAERGVEANGTDGAGSGTDEAEADVAAVRDERNDPVGADDAETERGADYDADADDTDYDDGGGVDAGL